MEDLFQQCKSGGQTTKLINAKHVNMTCQKWLGWIANSTIHIRHQMSSTVWKTCFSTTH